MKIPIFWISPNQICFCSCILRNTPSLFKLRVTNNASRPHRSHHHNVVWWFQHIQRTYLILLHNDIIRLDWTYQFHDCRHTSSVSRGKKKSCKRREKKRINRLRPKMATETQRKPLLMFLETVTLQTEVHSKKKKPFTSEKKCHTHEADYWWEMRFRKNKRVGSKGKRNSDEGKEIALKANGGWLKKE